jgi:hypothetical protein
VGESVALFADLGNTSAYSKRFRGVGSGSARKNATRPVSGWLAKKGGMLSFRTPILREESLFRFYFESEGFFASLTMTT